MFLLAWRGPTWKAKGAKMCFTNKTISDMEQSKGYSNKLIVSYVESNIVFS